jgi:glycosyltransferase involved in cell wall biosynthesis
MSAITGSDATRTPMRIAVILPCYNEEVAIAKVVGDFSASLPNAVIYVFDNNSKDNTRAIAEAAGAIVRTERQQGKGHVVARAFADVEADVYVMVDGDDTYDATAAPEMVDMLLRERLDMVTGIRVTNIQAAYRRGHRLGNLMLTGAVRTVFGDRITDMLSGYRVFSRRFVKSFPAMAQGFETETEFTVHAMELSMPLGEVKTAYRERPPGSTSKLRTYVDGMRILRTIMTLVKNERPLEFFGIVAAFLLLAGLALGLPVVFEFLETQLVPRLPRAVLAVGMVLLSFLSLSSGLVLASVARGRKEMKRLAYLAIPATGTGK